MAGEPRTAGWASDFPAFRATPARIVRLSLEEFVREATPEQISAWDDGVPALQTQAGNIIDRRAAADTYTAILEYELPLEKRRPDAVFLVEGAVVVIELKGKDDPSRADLDQAAAYARDLRAYHRDCQDRPVHAVVVPTHSQSPAVQRDDVWVTGPTGLGGLVLRLIGPNGQTAPDAARFLDVDAYRPLPTLVQAARELFERREIREVWRARAR